MARRNIFDIINTFSFDKEFERLFSWFKRAVIYKEIKEDMYTFKLYTFEQFANEYAILNWKQRNRFRNTSELLDLIGLAELIYNKYPFSTENKILWFEYALNIINIICLEVDTSDYWYTCYEEDIVSEMEKDIKYFIEQLGLESKVFPEEEQIIIVQKNKAATSVTELVSDNLARDIFEYNRFNMKGEIDEKREIIIKIAREYEGFEKELKSITKELGDNLGFMLNKFHIRHNNEKDLDKDQYCKKFLELSEDEQEAWYDKTYDLLLLAFLEKDAKDIHKELTEFKKV